MKHGAAARGSVLSDRQALWAFVLGCAAVTAGVIAHRPMFLMAVAMLAGFYGLVFATWWLAIVGALGVLVCLVGWLWRTPRIPTPSIATANGAST